MLKKVFTKQRCEVLDILLKDGRFTAKKEFVHGNEEAKLMLFAYDALMKNHPDIDNKPKDADYPVWLSFKEEATQLLQPGFLLLELEMDDSLITKLDIIKWTMVNNCLYIPKSPEDEIRHKELLKAFNVSDAKAYNSRFYPDIKREIEDSWAGLFEEENLKSPDLCYGLAWEIKADQIKRVIR